MHPPHLTSAPPSKTSLRRIIGKHRRGREGIPIRALRPLKGKECPQVTRGRSKFESDFLYLFIERESRSVSRRVKGGKMERRTGARLKVNRDISNTYSILVCTSQGDILSNWKNLGLRISIRSLYLLNYFSEILTPCSDQGRKQL